MKPFTMILLYAIGIFVLMYVFMVLPGKKKNKKVQEMHDSVAVGDEIITVGGVIGTVVARDTEILTLQIDDNGTCERVLIYAVQSIKTKKGK